MSGMPSRRLNTALLTVFRPLARLLLRLGIGAKPCIDLWKIAFVRVATSDYGKDGRPASISRVAQVTGLTRPVVRRLRESTVELEPLNDFYESDAAEILAYWNRTDRFLDKYSRPKPIEFGPGPGTFTDLVEVALGKSNALQHLSHLSEVGCVSVSADGLISMVRRELIISEDLSKLIGDVLGPLAGTINYNWGKPPEDGLCQRSVYSARIDPTKVDIFRRMARDRIINFMFEIDDVLTGLEGDGAQPFFNREDQELMRIGVGAYIYEIERESN